MHKATWNFGLLSAVRSKFCAELGAPVLSVKSRCPMHTDLSAPLSLLFDGSTWKHLDTCCWQEHVCPSLFRLVLVRARSTAAQACASMCIYVNVSACVQACLCMLRSILASGLCEHWWWRIALVGERDRESCTGKVAPLVMPCSSCT